MAASKELITKIVLRAQADGSISKAFSALSKNSDTCINKLKNIGSTAVTAFKGVATATAAGAVACAKAAIDFESAFAGVQKTVDETSTTSYEDLAAGIRQLAKETPAAATEIAEVAAAAGQLGIKADDILKFSKVMIDLGESTNLTSDEAATSIAKLFNVTGTSMDKVSNFGSTLVALGNNAATTESDILAMATRIAGSGKQIGLTEQQILALSTSLSSVGIEAEMGGSAISTTMSQIDKAVALNTEELSVWAKTAGMSTSEFAKAWNSDAYGALQKVLKGMATTKDEGGNLNVLLEDLGINAIRQGDMLKRLSSATGLMSEMTDLANKSWGENSALTTEANTRYATTASRLQILKNKITDAAITIGNKMLPAINNLIDKMDEIDFEAIGEKIGKTVTWITDNFDKIKVALGVLAGAFAAFKIGSFINTIGGAVGELKHLASALGITEKIAAAGGGFKGLASTVGTGVSGAFAKLGSALGAIGPWGWVIIAVVVALGVAFTALWKTSEDFRNKMTAIWNGLKEKFSSFGQGIVDRINLLGFDFKSFGELCKTVFSAIGKVLGHIFSAYFVSTFQHFAKLIGHVLDVITGFVDIVVGIFTGDWARVWDGVKAVVVGAVMAVVSTLTYPFEFLWALFGDLLKKIGSWISQVWSKLVTWAQNLWANVKTWFSNGINSIVTFFQELPSKIWTWLVSTAQKVAAWGLSLWAKAKEVGSNFVSGIVNFFQQLPYKIGYIIGFVIGKIILFGQKLWSFATVTVPQFIGKVIEWFKQLPSKIWTWLVNVVTKLVQWGITMNEKMRTAAKNAINAVINFFKTLPGKVWAWLTSTAQKVAAWGSNLWAKAKQIGSNVINAVVNFFKQLPGKVWTWLTNTVQKVATWGSQMIAKAKQAASDTFNAIVNKIKQLPSKMLSYGKNIVQGLWNGIKNAKDWLIGKIKEFAGGITDGIAKALGINSPSVVMEKLFKWVPRGAAEGILNNAKYAVNAVKSMGGKVTAAASKIVPTFGGATAKLQKFGTGGTVTTPQTAIVGDRPETIVPHGNTPRNRALLAEAAKGVGAGGGGAVFNFTFAPVLNGSNVDENRTMLRDEEEAFERQMQAWIEKNRRLAFNV